MSMFRTNEQLPSTLAEVLYRAAIDAAKGIQGNFARYSLLADLKNLGTTRVDIQDQGGTTIVPAAAGPVTLVSTSADDDIAGTGVREVLVKGVGADFTSGGPGLWLEEVIPMAGLGTATGSKAFLRINEIENWTVGSTTSHVGVVDASLDGNLQLRMGLDNGVPNGQSRSVNTTIPAGWVGMIDVAQITWSANQPLCIWLGVEVAIQFGPPSPILWPIVKTLTKTEVIPFGLSAFKGPIYIRGQAMRVGGGGTEAVDLHTTIGLVRV